MKLTPDAGVVGFELHCGEATRTDGLDVAAGGILGVADAAIPGAGALVEDVHVVAVKMEAASCVLARCFGIKLNEVERLTGERRESCW